MQEFLNQLLSSLNSIEVKGKNNLDILLGCMMAIENAIEQLNAPAEEQEATDGRQED